MIVSPLVFARRIAALHHGVHVLLALLTIFVGASIPIASAAPIESRVLPELQREAAQHPTNQFRVIVTRLGKTTDADTQVKMAGGTKIKDVAHANAFAAQVPGRAIFGLGHNPNVKYIAPDA